MKGAQQLLQALVRGAGAPPLAISRAMGRRLGWVAFWADRRHRQIVEQNLALSFENMTRAWVRRTALDAFAHLGMVAAEIPCLARFSSRQILARTRVHGAEVLHQALAQGKGVFFLTGHIGNWEWTGVASGLVFGPACIVARPLDWPPGDQVVNGWRTRFGSWVVPKNRSARQVLSTLRRGQAVGVLLDQNVDWYDGEWVDFFGRPACTNKGLALLARSIGAPVIPGYGFREDDGLFHLYIDPPVPLVKTRDKTQDIWDNTQNYTTALERAIRRKPEQWFWMHQRWKTRPYRFWPRELNK